MRYTASTPGHVLPWSLSLFHKWLWYSVWRQGYSKHSIVEVVTNLIILLTTGAGVLDRANFNEYSCDIPEEEFDTTLHGPWMERWEITHHNRHTEAMLKNKSYGRPFHSTYHSAWLNPLLWYVVLPVCVKWRPHTNWFLYCLCVNFGWWPHIICFFFPPQQLTHA